MCYHASQTKKVKQLEEHFKLPAANYIDTEDFTNEEQFTGYHLNGYDHPDMIIIPQELNKELHVGMWGLIPSENLASKQNEYYKSLKFPGSALNSQSEKVFTYDLYKKSILKRRCLIPLSGFFEPHKHKGVSHPVYFSRKDREVFCVAGIYTVTKDGAVTFSMLTKKASEWFGTIHNKSGDKRQIVILPQDLQMEWVRDDLKKEGIKELLNINYDEDDLEATTISRDLFSTSIDSNRNTIFDYYKYPGINEKEWDQNKNKF